jgi:hypothetical protein
LALTWAGGFHFDEAWAALFSHRIASEPDFWPIAAMSPYTSAWGHYITALFYKIFGTSLLIYRLSGISLVVLGVALLSQALKKMGQPRAGALLPWVIAFFSAAVINHRFAIEINTFHVFCLGLLAWGLSEIVSEKGSTWRSHIAVLASIVFGITSHVLFLAPAFALLILCFWTDRFLPENDPDKRKRMTAIASLIFLAGFFLRIHLGIPEKDKSFALLLLAALSLLGVLFPKVGHRALEMVQRSALLPVRIVFYSACVVALFFLAFFSEGSWAAAFFNGGQSDLHLILWPLVALGIGFASSRKTFLTLSDQNPRWKSAFLWAALTLILTTAMATKPAPRYFEVPFLMLACLFAIALANAPKRLAAVALFIWILAGALQLDRNYIRPALAGNVPESAFRFLFFKDNSSDTLLKQKLARSLANSGCTFQQVRSNDIRILDPLKFLSIGDWSPSPPSLKTSCLFGPEVRVERKSQLSPPLSTPATEIGPFILYTTPHP